jgi:hypothetical protein
MFTREHLSPVENQVQGLRMDRRNYPVSVVPYPIDKAPSYDKASGVRSDVRDDSAEWDSKWLRPNLKLATTQVTREQSPAAPQQQGQEAQEEKTPLYLRFLRWLFPEVNQRRAVRFPTPGLVAYYWTGGAPYSHQVGDISATGIFLLTKERWAPGTLIQMTLQQQDGKGTRNNTISVLSEVVRWGESGSGFNFILSDYENLREYGVLPSETIDRKSVEQFLHRIGVSSRA